MLLTRKTFITSAVLYFICQIFFLINIQFPRGHDFDEFHYVPAAKKFLELKMSNNWEHPPLGKVLMAVGIAIGGDRPLGWRLMSTVFGSMTMVGMYFLGLVLFRNRKTALWVAIITFFNQLLYVQSRIGMLDTFMFGFLIWSLVAFCASWDPKYNMKELRQLFLVSGIFLGLAIGCKWFAVVPWIACCLLVGVIHVLRLWKTTFNNPSDEDWYRPNLWKGLNWKDWAFCLGAVPIWVYYLTLIPLLFLEGQNYSIYDFFFGIQAKMWDGQLRVVHSHPYMSRWTDWPLLNRPIWYAFDKEGPQLMWVRGVLLIGNPLLMWTGLVAIFACFWDWIHVRSRDAFLILYFYSVFYLCWAIIPRKILFYYYYYPAGMMLSLALAYVFHHREYGKPFHHPWARWVFVGAAAALFIYFFPILAGLKIPAQSFRYWMWFESWI